MPHDEPPPAPKPHDTPPPPILLEIRIKELQRVVVPSGAVTVQVKKKNMPCLTGCIAAGVRAAECAVCLHITTADAGDSCARQPRGSHGPPFRVASVARALCFLQPSRTSPLPLSLFLLPLSSQLHASGADHTTRPTPVLNGYSNVEAWTRLSIPRPDEGAEFSVWLVRAGWAASLWPTPFEIFLGRAVLPDLGVPAGPPGTRGPWEVARLELRRSNGTDFFSHGAGREGEASPPPPAAPSAASSPTTASPAVRGRSPSPAPPSRRTERAVAAAERCPGAARARAAARAGEAAAARAAAAQAALALTTTSFDDEDGGESEDGDGGGAPWRTSRSGSPDPRIPPAALGGDTRGRSPPPPPLAGRTPSPEPRQQLQRQRAPSLAGASPSPSPSRAGTHGRAPSSSPPPPFPFPSPPRPRARSEDVYALPPRYGTPPGVGWVGPRGRASSPGGSPQHASRAATPPPRPATADGGGSGAGGATAMPLLFQPGSPLAIATEGEGDATDIRLPEWPHVLHGARGWLVVEWRVTVVGGGEAGREGHPQAVAAVAQPAEVPITRLPVHLHSYAHGGFMGLAASMMADPAWRAALAAEDPAAAGRAAGLWAAAGGDPTAAPALKLPLVLENSPVLCAYGYWRLGCCVAPPTWSAAPSRSSDGGGGPRVTFSAPLLHQDARLLTSPFATAPPPTTSTAACPLRLASAEPADGGPAGKLLVLPPRPPRQPATAAAAAAAAAIAAAATARHPVWPPGAAGPPARAPSLVDAFLAGGGAAAALSRRASSFVFATAALGGGASGDESSYGGGGLLDHPAISRLLAGRASVADLATFVGGEGGEGGGGRGRGRSPLTSSSSDDDDDYDGDDGDSGTPPPATDGGASTAGLEEEESWPASTSAAPTTGPQEASGLARVYAHSASAGGRGRSSPGATTPAPHQQPAPTTLNRYGFSIPCGLEWDLWIDPASPADLAKATVDHGTPGALLAQAATSGLPGLRAFARAAGAARILSEGVAPAAWLTAFGRAVNRAVAGDPGTPLPLSGPPGFSYRLHARVDAGRGTLFGQRPLRARGASRVYVRASVRGSTTLPRARGPPGEAPPAASGDGSSATSHADPATAVIWSGPGAGFTFWPVAAPLAGAVLHLEVRATGFIAGRLRHRRLGAADVPLTSSLITTRPGGGQAPPPPVWVAIEPTRPRRRRATGVVGVVAGEVSEGAATAPAPQPLPPLPPLPPRPASLHGLLPRGAPSGSEADRPAPPLTSRTSSLRALGGALAAAALGGGGRAALQPSASEVDLLALGRGHRFCPVAAEQAERLLPPPSLPASSSLRRRRAGGSATTTTDDDEAAVPPTALGGGGGAPAAPTPPAGQLRLWLRLEEVCHLAAAEEAGIDRAAAQTAVALLSAPGGLFLDVKSGYSTSTDIQLFAGALGGLGVHVTAVASFAKRQLVPPRHQAAGAAVSTRLPVPGVRLFHGLNTLELAVDRGSVARGEAVLFNGASLVLPHTAGRRAAAAAADPATRPASAGGVLQPGGGLLDPVALRRCVAIIERAGCAAGVYLQEADAGAAAVDALTRAVISYAPIFPLGFAYGGLPGLAIAALSQAGRGFAAQQTVDELAARRSLAKRAAGRVARGEHAAGSLTAAIALAHRLLRGAGPSPLSLRHQTLLLRLLFDLWPPPRLGAAITALGGPAALITRFWAHYEATSSLTAFELGANWNRTKPLLRLLRDRGVLAEQAWPEKAALVDWLASPALYGQGLTYILMARGVRAGLHKFAKEGLCCVLESCTAAEAGGVVSLLGGRRALMRRLRGNMPWSSSAYARRVEAVEAVHAADPAALAVDCGPGGEDGEGPRLGPTTGAPLPTAPYGALPHRRRDTAPPPWVLAARIEAAGDPGPGGVGWTTSALLARLAAARRRSHAAWRYGPCHSRDKNVGVYVWRAVRKVGVALLTGLREAGLAAATGGLWPLLVTLPRLVAPFLSGAVGTSAAVAAMVLSVGTLVALLVRRRSGEAVGGGGVGVASHQPRRPQPRTRAAWVPFTASTTPDLAAWKHLRTVEVARVRARAMAAAARGGEQRVVIVGG